MIAVTDWIVMGGLLLLAIALLWSGVRQLRAQEAKDRQLLADLREWERLEEARRQRADRAFERAAAVPAERLRQMADAVDASVERGESFTQLRERLAPLATTYRPSAPAPAPAPCPTQQPHQYLPGGIYAPASDSRSDRSDCGGSSWSSSSDSSSSCDSSSSSSGGGE